MNEIHKFHSQIYLHQTHFVAVFDSSNKGSSNTDKIRIDMLCHEKFQSGHISSQNTLSFIAHLSSDLEALWRINHLALLFYAEGKF